MSEDRFWKLRDAVRDECEALEAWARTELITDDGFAQSCVLAAVGDIRKVLRDAARMVPGAATCRDNANRKAGTE